MKQAFNRGNHSQNDVALSVVCISLEYNLERSSDLNKMADIVFREENDMFADHKVNFGGPTRVCVELRQHLKEVGDLTESGIKILSNDGVKR